MVGLIVVPEEITNGSNEQVIVIVVVVISANKEQRKRHRLLLCMFDKTPTKMWKKLGVFSVIHGVTVHGVHAAR